VGGGKGDGGGGGNWLFASDGFENIWNSAIAALEPKAIELDSIKLLRLLTVYVFFITYDLSNSA